jgi:hypothetical protein
MRLPRSATHDVPEALLLDFEHIRSLYSVQDLLARHLTVSSVTSRLWVYRTSQEDDQSAIAHLDE